ncbi:MAG TPA: DUF488 domain-containing protein [Methylocystis sp.]
MSSASLTQISSSEILLLQRPLHQLTRQGALGEVDLFAISRCPGMVVGRPQTGLSGMARPNTQSDPGVRSRERVDEPEAACTLPFFTVGHSTRSLAEFVSLLNSSRVQLVADVRSIPRSRRNPQYNIDTLPMALSRFHINYEHIPELGGLRGELRQVPAETNAFWRERSFHNYADFAMSESFRSGLGKLRDIGHAQCCSIMCAEALWWRCHRRIIADYLIAAGESVFHILGPGRVEPARMTPAAKPQANGSLIYPAPAASAWPANSRAWRAA